MNMRQHRKKPTVHVKIKRTVDLKPREIVINDTRRRNEACQTETDRVVGYVHGRKRLRRRMLSSIGAISLVLGATVFFAIQNYL